MVGWELLHAATRALRHRHGASGLLVQTAVLVSFALCSGHAAARTIHIVALGDSLTAGFGLAATESFPSVLTRRLRDEGFDAEVANAGVSGDTATGGLERLEWSIPDSADLVIVELGANDMLRDVPPAITRAALDTILGRLRARHIPAVLAGMKSVTNWGGRYRADFERIYPELSTSYNAPLYPFFLDGVAGHADLLLGDGLHPNAKGVERMVDSFTAFLSPILIARFGATSGSR